MNILYEPLSKVLRTTSTHLKTLREMGIVNAYDLLHYFPRAYLEQTQSDIASLVPGETHVVKGRIKKITTSRTRSLQILTALITDGTGTCELKWFNQMYIKNMIREGMDLIVSGKVQFDFGKFGMINPKIEKGENEAHTAEIIPIYVETMTTSGNGKISSNWLREKIKPLLYLTDFIEETLPVDLMQDETLIDKRTALKEIHFPTSIENLEKAKERLGFEELFILQLNALHNKQLWEQSGATNEKVKTDKALNEKVLNNLPFKLTNGQIATLEDIFQDIEAKKMFRLVQGDVGSGKTVVAALTAVQFCNKGYQVAVMAPTSILAKQHYKSFKNMLERFGVKIELLIGAMSDVEKNEIKSRIKNGETHILIGTHALIQDTVEYKDLKLAIIDEQHRFGVKQREALKNLGAMHILNMSATPIPRTLALTVYGDQDISIIDELPPGRQEILTRVVPENKRLDAYKWIREQVTAGRQAFIICPLVSESEKLENVKAAIEHFENLQNNVFPDLKLGLIHGKLPDEEKEEIMKRFSENNTNILVSTSVVEVGIDVPNASIMIIEGAERFGLSQLHQFRGRVGRGTHQSYCFLFPGNVSEEGITRLGAMVKYNSGFKLSEIDMQMRGPGEVYGIKQSGIPDLKIANLGDSRMVNKARVAAKRIIDKGISNYPNLQIKINKHEAYFA